MQAVYVRLYLDLTTVGAGGVSDGVATDFYDTGINLKFNVHSSIVSTTLKSAYSTYTNSGTPLALNYGAPAYQLAVNSGNYNYNDGYEIVTTGDGEFEIEAGTGVFKDANGAGYFNYSAPNYVFVPVGNGDYNLVAGTANYVVHPTNQGYFNYDGLNVGYTYVGNTFGDYILVVGNSYELNARAGAYSYNSGYSYSLTGEGEYNLLGNDTPFVSVAGGAFSYDDDNTYEFVGMGNGFYNLVLTTSQPWFANVGAGNGDYTNVGNVYTYVGNGNGTHTLLLDIAE